MTTLLRQVLDEFDVQTGPASVAEMARRLGVEPGALQGMLDYWVRKGRLRVVSSCAQSCSGCGSAKACPFVMTLPPMYERVGDA